MICADLRKQVKSQGVDWVALSLLWGAMPTLRVKLVAPDGDRCLLSF